jgi:hypothetical protein
MKILVQDTSMSILWNNGKDIYIDDSNKSDPEFWKIIEILLEDAHKEGGMVALKLATENAQLQIDAKKKLKSGLIL